MVDPEKDIFAYALARVNNKSVALRVRNSPKLHSIRSALKTKGSFASKGIGALTAGLRIGMGAIPIPGIVTDLLKIAQQAVEKKIRSKLHERHIAAVNLEERVKFTLKELSVEELDRYRWKLKDAVDELNKKSATLDALYLKKTGEGKPCGAWLEITEAYAQVERRQNKLVDACKALRTVLDDTTKWGEEVTKVINVKRKEQGVKFAAVIAAETKAAEELEKKTKGSGDEAMTAKHANCESWCYYNNTRVDENATWTKIKEGLALVTKTIAEPLDLETFASIDGSEYGAGGD